MLLIGTTSEVKMYKTSFNLLLAAVLSFSAFAVENIFGGMQFQTTMNSPLFTQQNTNYIFRNMKIYSSTEWLADNKKKYRSVFDKNESSYIYTEFSFFR